MTVRARDLNSAKSVSGYSLAVLADYSVPPVFPPLPILQSEQGVLARFSEKCFVRGEKNRFFNPFPKKI